MIRNDADSLRCYIASLNNPTLVQSKQDSQFEQALGQSTSTDSLILTLLVSILGHLTKSLSSATLCLTRTHYQHG